MAQRNPISKPTRTRLNPRARALAWLSSHSWPRLVMSMMLTVTVGSAFLTSVQLHHWAFKPLVRYPLAVITGWVVFLLLVGVWVMWQRRSNAPTEPSTASTQVRQNSSSRSDGLSSIDLPLGRPAGGSWNGGGGRFGGGGASDSFASVPEDVGAGEGVSIFDSSSGTSGSSSSGSGFDLDVDGDLGGFLLLIAAIVLVAFAVFGAAFYAVYNAPIFFAELLIDGGVGTWLYKRANVGSRPDWISTAIKRSVWPVLILIVLFVGLAWTMHYVAPNAMTLGAALDTFINAP
jgi:hypothetical protein